MEEYKISLWEDYRDFCYIEDENVTSENFSNKVYYTKSGNTYTRAQSYISGTTYYYKKLFFNERQICEIGSNNSTALIRAFEPQLTEEINGTHSFTFKLFYYYKDEITGEKIKNPIINYISNERKIKVKWKNKWYDFIVKNSNEDSNGKSITYTCTDLFINELSKNGYSLEFNSELLNNTGTANELISKVLEGTEWQYDSLGSDLIIQKNEEPVYEVGNESSSTYKIHSFNAINLSNNDTSITIPNNAIILVYYSQALNLYNESDTTNVKEAGIQFLYSNGGYSTEENSMLVTNGSCCYAKLYWKNFSGGYLNAYADSGCTLYILRINCGAGVSEQYRAKRLVKTLISEYDELLLKYCYLYTEGSGQNIKEVYGVETTEYSDFLEVTNYLTNSSSFSNTNGWSGAINLWHIYPKFTSETRESLASYTAKSYLLVNNGNIYNTCFSSNLSKFTPTLSEIKSGKIGGFQKGDKFIFRYKAKTDTNTSDNRPGTYITSGITPLVTTYNTSTYAPSGNNYISYGSPSINNNWVEYICTCITAVSAEDINSIGFFILSNGNYWIEDIQFFKYAIGQKLISGLLVNSIIYPGEASTTSLAKKTYRYFYKNHTITGNPVSQLNPAAENAKLLVYIYSGENPSSSYTPVYNNYEKYGSIEEKESNRFNILLSIAETFLCWIRFNIQHDANGKITIINGSPQKFITILEEIGEDKGLSFEYGIDLNSINRTIASDSIATKIIVLPNQNDFAINGFCTIARSDQNYSKENFILDLGYYTSLGLINQEELNRDLYSTQEEYIGYYYHLHKCNGEYDAITEELTELNSELIKLEAELKVLNSKVSATILEIGDNESDLMRLANVTTWEGAKEYALSHSDNTKVLSLMTTHAQLIENKDKYSNEQTNLSNTVTRLKNNINNYNNRLNELSQFTSNLHEQFNKKYFQYLQEGTWQDESYIDDNLYYLDGLSVAYTSSRPQVSYDIKVIRVSSLEEFSSKVFKLGDICYVQDREFFGYGADGVTPYKEKILVNKIISNFDNPEKDTITVLNYKTQFDDLFLRITATTQSLQYSEGSYNKAAGVINPDKTLSFATLQDTFDYNSNLVLNTSNQNVTWNETGITVTDNIDSAKKAKLMAGGLFISNDGGIKWKNAVRGDGISADVLTAGKINTSEIYLYDGDHSTFRWDSQGINSYYYDNNSTSFNKYIRFDKFGIYGYNGIEDFVPELEYTSISEDLLKSIWGNNYVKFGMTWRGFFLKGGNNDSTLKIESYKENNTDQISFSLLNKYSNYSLELSTDKDIVLKKKNALQLYDDLINIGRFDNNKYGIRIKNSSGLNVFTVDATGLADYIGGWNLNGDSFYHIDGSSTIGLYGNPETTIIQGESGKYAIKAGTSFGITVDGKVVAASGKIGGWTIGTNSLYSDEDSNHYKITIGSNGSISGGTSNTTNYWSINRNGTATFNNIIANGGTISGWNITNEGLVSDGGIITTNSGNWEITGSLVNVYNGTIGNSSITSGGLNGGNFTNVNVTGTLTAGNIVITTNQISVDGTTLTRVNTGTITCSGGFSASNITASGSIVATGMLLGNSLHFISGESTQELNYSNLNELLTIKTALNLSATLGYVLTKGTNNSLIWSLSSVGTNPTFEGLTVTGPTTTQGLILSGNSKIVFRGGTGQGPILTYEKVLNLFSLYDSWGSLAPSDFVKSNTAVTLSSLTINGHTINSDNIDDVINAGNWVTSRGADVVALWTAWHNYSPSDFMPASGTPTAVFG